MQPQDSTRRRTRQPSIDLTGLHFGRLTVLVEGARRGYKRYYTCECVCGKRCNVSYSNLRSGHTMSCGCWREELRPTYQRAHGLSHVVPEYYIWTGMLQRCNNANNMAYPSYGGRGIKVCSTWTASFEQFYRDVGPRPSTDHSLDRIDNDGNYEPSNVRWATRVEQASNRRQRSDARLLTYRGETLHLSAWARRLNVRPSTIGQRLANGWSVERALSTPVRHPSLPNHV